MLRFTTALTLQCSDLLLHCSASVCTGPAPDDHLNGCILEVVVGADILPGGGKAICDSGIADVERIGITVPFIGSATDNASDVINAFVKHMQAIKLKFLSFHNCANCHCHFRRSI